MSKIDKGIDIILVGYASSGKTVLVHHIGKALTEAGVTVEVNDAGESYAEFKPQKIWQPDPARVARIATYMSWDQVPQLPRRSPAGPAKEKAMDEAKLETIRAAIKALENLEPVFLGISRDLCKSMVDLQGTNTNHIYLHFDRHVATAEASCKAAITQLQELDRLSTVLDHLCDLPANMKLFVHDQNRQAPRVVVSG